MRSLPRAHKDAYIIFAMSSIIFALSSVTITTREFVATVGDKVWGLFGSSGFFLPLSQYTPGVAAIFLFQAVFMLAGSIIPTGALAERWKFGSFVAFTQIAGLVARRGR